METTIRFHLINSIPSLSITEEPKIESYINLQTIYYVLTLKKTNLQQTFMKKLKHSKVLRKTIYVFKNKYVEHKILL